MATKRAGEIMIPLGEYPHIPLRYTIRQAVEEMEAAVIVKNGRHSLPRALLVFDRDYELVGTVRRRDLLRTLEPQFLRSLPVHHQRKLFDVEADVNLVDISVGRIADAVKANGELPVANCVRPMTGEVYIGEHLAKVIYKMFTFDQNLLPVLDNHRNVMGVVRSVDVFHEISSILLEEMPEPHLPPFSDDDITGISMEGGRDQDLGEED